MELFKLLLFIPACFALNMTPGPNNLLAMNNARCFGFKASFVGSLGRLIAFSGMITLTALGLAAILYTSELVFFGVKVVGAVYLFWMAIQLWRSESSPMYDLEASQSLSRLATQEFTVAAGNPKAILIFTAFLPQFVDTAANINEQFFILGVTYLVLEMLAISVYAIFGLYLRHWFEKPRMAKLFNRGCAIFLGASSGNLLFGRQA